MDLSVAVRRLGYRLASRGIALVWALLHVRPDGVKCVITDGDRLLLVRHSYGPRGWDLPGGASRRGEPAADTARREMREELGIDVAVWHDLGELRSLRGSHRIRLLGAEVRSPALRLDPVELVAAEWFARDGLPDWTGPLLAPVLRGLVRLDAAGVHELHLAVDVDNPARRL